MNDIISKLISYESLVTCSENSKLLTEMNSLSESSPIVLQNNSIIQVDSESL